MIMEFKKRDWNSCEVVNKVIGKPFSFLYKNKALTGTKHLTHETFIFIKV
jgi:hypothetical protein